MRKMVGYVLRKAGYQAIPTEMLRTFGEVGQMRHLQALIEKKRVDCVFDVGANKGQYRDLLRNDIGFQGTILSFEPVPRLAESLHARAESDAAWQVFPCALGSVVDTMNINVTKNSDLSSIRQPSLDVDWSGLKHMEVEEVVEIKVNRLDAMYGDLLETHRFQRPFLKVDTQGFDLEVFKGAGPLLSNFVGLQTELAYQSLYKDMPLQQEVFMYLNDKEFSLSGIYPISLDESMQLIEADGIFVRDQKGSQ
ncbi:MAG: FkbM family methyltransferase [Gammaproteobacteria bacterium]|jgi:FkbM family methyltransferase